MAIVKTAGAFGKDGQSNNIMLDASRRRRVKEWIATQQNGLVDQVYNAHLENRIFTMSVPANADAKQERRIRNNIVFLYQEFNDFERFCVLLVGGGRELHIWERKVQETPLLAAA